MHVEEEVPFKAGIAFRLPKDEDPEAFEEHLRVTGLVSGEFGVLPRGADDFWERCIVFICQDV
jgi:hypothetical protein